ncbi:DinB family protein [Mucilaginibacter myungsuensis]
MLKFIAEQNVDVNTPVPAFHNKTVGFMLLHVANVYRHWLGNFGMGNGLGYYDDSAPTDIGAIRDAFDDVDDLVNAFFNKFGNDLDLPIIGTISGGRQFTFTPTELFTHVITHEFHHKGQAMSMCSLLGHTPPDTDLIRT